MLPTIHSAIKIKMEGPTKLQRVPDDEKIIHSAPTDILSGDANSNNKSAFVAAEIMRRYPFVALAHCSAAEEVINDPKVFLDKLL